MMKLVFLLLAVLASTPTRSVQVTWSAAAPTGIIGYDVYRDGTKLTSSPVTSLSYIDPAVPIGSTVTYGVVALATPCTPTTPVTQTCGSSQMATAVANVPVAPIMSVLTVVIP